MFTLKNVNMKHNMFEFYHLQGGMSMIFEMTNYPVSYNLFKSTKSTFFIFAAASLSFSVNLFLENKK